jgi:PDZ domain-containing protein
LVTDLEQFQGLMAKTKPGDEVVLDFRRKNATPGVTTVKLGSAPDKKQGVLGIGVVEAPWAPFTINFNLANIGGPSAGLVFSLAVIDKLTTGDLSGDRFVAGTGTINSDGKVGSIGGITHKILAAHEAGATVFLVPADNCDEAKSAHQDGIDLVKVNKLGDAVDALKALSAGGEASRC